MRIVVWRLGDRRDWDKIQLGDVPCMVRVQDRRRDRVGFRQGVSVRKENTASQTINPHTGRQASLRWKKAGDGTSD